MIIYNIRPHTIELIAAIQPFFEIIGISNISFKELSYIIDHFEKILNNLMMGKNQQTLKQINKIQEQ
jgi:hypothetical protein